MSDGPHVLESPDEVLSTLKKDGRRRWLYPVLSKGVWLNRRRILGWILIAVYMLLPVVHFAGKPLVLLDLVTREFTILGVTLYANDTLVLMLFVLAAFTGILLLTAVLGRAWCGWACPQTVYLEFVYRAIERLVEGKANKRARLDDGSGGEIHTLKKGIKFTLYLLVSVVLAHTFAAYFAGWERLLTWMSEPPAEHWGYFVLAFGLTGLILFDFAYFREQMCTIACPYARLQAGLLDQDSLIVSYDVGRGETRGRRTKKVLNLERDGEAKLNLGDCIDCGACVRTCPTGIDIRQGLQMECVSCTQCVDACDEIMHRVHKPLGLIRYTSLNRLEGTKSPVVRTRTVIYAVIFVVLLGAFALALAGLEPVDMNIARATGAPFNQLPDGRVANRVRLRLHNRTASEHTFEIVPERDDFEIRVVGQPKIVVKAGELIHLDAWVVTPADLYIPKGRYATSFTIDAVDPNIPSQDLEFNLLGPATDASKRHGEKQ